MITFRRLVEMTRRFPGIEVGTSYGTPALKVGRKLVLRMHQKEDAIVLPIETVEEQKRLIESDPMAFFITDHYVGYAAVLIRPTVEKPVLMKLIERSWRRVARSKDLQAYPAV